MIETRRRTTPLPSTSRISASFLRPTIVAVALAWAVTLQSFAAETIGFNRDIRPILSDKCFFCHGPDAAERKAGFRLDLEESAKGDLGGYRVIVPGRPDTSELFRRITSDDPDDLMPPPDSGKELTTAEIEVLRRWISAGAEYERHWAFVAPRRPAIPSVMNGGWTRNPIDDFVLARLESMGLEPSPDADPVTLIRRLYFDLSGLPPSPAEADAFRSRPDRNAAVIATVDELLASPHFGERMAVYWLDLVRYADTVGYHGDQEHHISSYRDYVIKAFNDNLPFDQFTREQLAGDLLPDADPWRKIASGYNRVLQTTHEGGAQDREYLAKYAADRVRNVSSVWLGATMGCAECHDHKFDPFTQKDFYSLAAFFADIKEQGAFSSPNSSPTVREPEMPAWDLVQFNRLESIKHQLTELRVQLEGASQNTRAAIQSEIDALTGMQESITGQFRPTMITVSVAPRPTRILRRGDWMDETGPEVQPATPHFLPGNPGFQGSDRATRLDLARWLTGPDNPLTARAFVNRLWKLYFGAGLSRVLDDLGAQGEPPTHPDLLDWLAVEFVESGWDVKHMIRLITTSAAYRQSSVTAANRRALDPDNRWIGRQSSFRLPAEFVRDNALAVSGLLVRQIGGPSARPYQPKGYYQHLNFPTREYVPDEDRNQYRRGVYMHWQRIFLHPMLKAFDAPSREECTAERSTSNTPLAALTLLNDPTFVEASRAFAIRIMHAPHGNRRTFDDQLAWAWRQALSRNPADAELELLKQLWHAEHLEFSRQPESAREFLSVGLTPIPGQTDPTELAAWTSVARALLNLHETITRN